MPDILEISDLGICQRCLGRIFATAGGSLDNMMRGEKLLFSLKALNPEVDPNIVLPPECSLCRGAFESFDMYYNIVMDEIGELEYDTFLIGSIFEKDLLEDEEKIQARFGSRGESMKKEFNREFGKYFSHRAGKEVEFNEPDLTVIIDTRYDYARTEIRSIYICGRYNKYRRDLPQTRWIHRPDNPESVEFYTGEPMNRAFGGTNYYLHAAGREDVDVRMLGGGRDFVMEISRPLRKYADLEKIEEEINRSGSGVAVNGLALCTKENVKNVKETTFDKTYRVVVNSEMPIDLKRLETALKDITGKVIYQRTPLRVAVRRADLVRQRSIRESLIEEVSGNTATILLRAESGMYIKELINGDKERTSPSLSSEYGKSLAVAELDVVEINRGN